MIRICEMTADNLPSESEIVNKPDSVCPVRWAADVCNTARLATCGKGVFCRDGLRQLYLIAEDIASDKGSLEDIDLLNRLCDNIMRGNDCELSYKAAKLMKLSLTNYEAEWKAHILRKRCKAGVCQAFAKNAPVVAPAAEGGRRRRGGSAAAQNAASNEESTVCCPWEERIESGKFPMHPAIAVAPFKRRRRSGK